MDIQQLIVTTKFSNFIVLPDYRPGQVKVKTPRPMTVVEATKFFASHFKGDFSIVPGSYEERMAAIGIVTV